MVAAIEIRAHDVNIQILFMWQAQLIIHIKGRHIEAGRGIVQYIILMFSLIQSAVSVAGGIGLVTVMVPEIDAEHLLVGILPYISERGLELVILERRLCPDLFVRYCPVAEMICLLVLAYPVIVPALPVDDCIEH